MRLSHDLPSRCARLTFTILMVLAWCGYPQWAGGEGTQAPARENGQRLARSLGALEALGRDTSKESFEPRALVQRVGREPLKLFQWVRDNTFFVPYRGALRGPAGVLMDRVGNSLDRSLLLAELLRLSGQPVRLARAPLDEATAGKLAEQVRAYPGRSIVPQGGKGPEEMRKQVVGYAQQAQMDPAEVLGNYDRAVLRQDRLVEDLAVRTAEQTAILSSALPATANNAGDAAAAKADMVAALRDHWWVQCQQEGKWVDMDVLLPQAEVGQAPVAPAKQTLPVKPQDGSVALPDDARQDLNIRVVIEQWQKGKVKLLPMLSVRLSAMDLLGVPITLQHIPGSWPKDLPLNGEADPAALKKALLSQHQWLPVLNVGRRQVADQGFGDNGNGFARGRFGGQEEVGKAVGNTFGGFGGALAGGEAPDASGGQVTAEWIEFEFRTPGQPARTIRQEVFDLIGPVVRLSKDLTKVEVGEAQQIQRALKLLGPARLLAVPCTPTSEYLTCLLAEAAQDLSQAIGGDGQVDRAKAISAASQGGLAHSPLYQWSSVRFQAGTNSQWAYLSSLNLVGQRIELGLDESGKLTAGDRFDVLANEVAVCAAAGEKARAVRMEQGVADTVAEDLCVGVPSPMENTTGIMSLAVAQGQRPAVVRQAGQGDWEKLPAAARARMQQDLAGGYALVVASDGAGAAADGARAGWWRVDEKTGQTIGVMDNGYHGSYTEAIILGALIGIAVGLFIVFVVQPAWASLMCGLDFLGTECKPPPPPKKMKTKRTTLQNFGQSPEY